MLIRLDENHKIIITEKAYFVKEFRDLYNYYYTKLKKPDRGIAAFGIMYFMYNFDSDFLADYEDEDERFEHVRKFVYFGEEVTRIKLFEAAVSRYKSLVENSQTYAYVVMKNNFKKLREYAKRITLVDPRADTSDPDYDPNTVDLFVDYKEFAAINTLLPKQEEELRRFKETLQKHITNEMDLYGGGSLGAYE